MLPRHFTIGSAKSMHKGLILLFFFFGLSGFRNEPRREKAAENCNTDQISATFTPTSAFI